jgi:hypothetical protein
MGEAPVRDRHRREAERFQRLSELSLEPVLRQKLARIAELHRRIAEQLDALELNRDQQPPPRARRLSPGDRTGRYELRFLNGREPIFSHEIHAESDIVALRIAFALQDACADLYRNFELWQGLRRIAKSSDARGVRRPAQPPVITPAMQEVILETMEALLNSGAVIARDAHSAALRRLEARPKR